jgi:hypothetical protein
MSCGRGGFAYPSPARRCQYREPPVSVWVQRAAGLPPGEAPLRLPPRPVGNAGEGSGTGLEAFSVHYCYLQEARQGYCGPSHGPVRSAQRTALLRRQPAHVFVSLPRRLSATGRGAKPDGRIEKSPQEVSWTIA